MREDDDDEGDGTETFEDYEGARIAFGGNTAKKAQDKRRVAFSLDLEMAQTEEHTASIPGQVPEKTEDDELLAWEESRIRQGQGLNPTLVSLRKEEGAVVPDFSLPQPGPLPEFTDILSLQTSLTAELDTQVQSERQLSEQLVRDGVELENNLAAITPNMAQVSKHYDFYQELKEFVYNHADFLQAKVRSFTAT